MTVIYSIILAGGSGINLWPLSREMYPKQIIKIGQQETLLQKTFLRLASICDDKNIITSVNSKHASTVKEQLKLLQEKFCRKSPYTMLTEPISKNTAPALSLAVNYICSNNQIPHESILIIASPCDHIISQREKFAQYIEKGLKLAKEGYIVSFATETKEINEKFGYLKLRKNSKITEIESGALKVSEFITGIDTKEKKASLKGKFYKNTGIYIFSASTYMEELKKYNKNIYQEIFKSNIKTTIPSIDLNTYNSLPNISIDNAVIEKSSKVVAIPFNIEWEDAGSWDVIFETSPKDKNGNYFQGKVIDMGSKNSMVYSSSKLLATIGLNDKIVISTEDAVFVGDKNKVNKSIKNICKKLNGKNSGAKEIHKTVQRPWGYYTVLEEGSGFLTKCINVYPNSKLSLQKHNHRSEHWIILEGEATVIKNDTTYKLLPGESIDINIKEIHSLQNLSSEELKIIEVQQGDILDENDIERLEDIYGRV